MKDKKTILLFILILVLLGIIGSGAFLYFGQKNKIKIIESASTKLEKELASSTASYLAQVDRLEKTIDLYKNENSRLMSELGIEKGKNDYFEFQLSQLTGSVSTLEKLAKTDPELLIKYSKIFFLNEHYTPDTLTDISQTEFVLNKDKTITIHSKIWPFLQTMLLAARNAGHELRIISGYRSFHEQSSLKNAYTVTYGSGANSFSADQGYSEHQLGTTVDFTTSSLGSNFTKFDESKAFTWLKENAYKFGFILSYPERNGYYIYEPWHWRFVGVKLSAYLHTNNKHFYDLDQREIDSYLISIFD